MSLVNYRAIFPAFWVLRNKYPDAHRPYRVPAHRTVSIWLTLVVTLGISQLLAPGVGDNWFSDAYRPAGWVADQGRPYYLTQLAVLLFVVSIAALFWYLGRRNLANTVTNNEVVEAEVFEEEATSTN
jgi:amino acid transporter